MPLPVLDDRKYPQILDEALARISVHNPEWTNFNDSDPGVTLLQLFAFTAESLHYRANLIPERNRLKFLELLRIPRIAPAAAQGVVAIANERGPTEVVTLSENLTVSAGPIRFVSRNGLDLLPIEARLYIKRSLGRKEEDSAKEIYDQLYSALAEDTDNFIYYETTPVEFPTSGASVAPLDVRNRTVDDSVWVALLARENDSPASVAREIAGKTLTLGLMPAVDVSSLERRADGREPSEAPQPLTFSISTTDLIGPAKEQPKYSRLEARLDRNPLEELTLAQLTLPGENEFGTWRDLDPTVEGTGEFPPTLEEEEVAGRVVAWILIRPSGPDSSAATPVDLKLSWVGINAVRVSQQADVRGELVGQGNGEPDQQFHLVNTPVIADSVSLKVDGVDWQKTDDLLAAPPEVATRGSHLPPVTTAVASGETDATQTPASQPPGQTARVYVVDRASGVIRFGDGLRGARPRGPIVASYSFGGGANGNVGIGAINSGAELPSGFTVVNPVPTWGGSEGESVSDSERRIPTVFRHRDRAVSLEDWNDILDRTPGIDLGRREVLPLVHPELDVESPGSVTVLVIPADPQSNGAPQPDRFFLEAVCRHVGPRRLLTTEVHVAGPTYVPIAVAIGIDVVPGRDIAPVREGVQARIRRFLSPLEGGFNQKDGPLDKEVVDRDQKGWPLDKEVLDRELMAQASRETGVAGVRDLKLWKITPDGYVPSTEISIQGLELPHLREISVVAGDPLDLSAPPLEIPTDGDGTGGIAGKRVPVPVVPPEC